MQLVKKLISQNRQGERIGLPCFCTANEYVLRAILSNAAKTNFPTVIEATCNQVNQDGGYTGMNPQQFMDWLASLAKETGVAPDHLIVGGDHLGPNPWRDELPEIAMSKARELVKQYVKAGFQKIHLDTSMACKNESNLSFETIASRAADLCQVAEENAPDPEKLMYIIGTEVPIPGGETIEPDALDVTSVNRFYDTINTHKSAFAKRNLSSAWQRVVSVVTQPGVDFGHSTIYPFVPDRAASLSASIDKQKGLSFEAHSTDYQSNEALGELVSKHFFFLKVGPELTFRFREAIWALAYIEETLGLLEPSRIRSIIEEQMMENPESWMSYYRGDEQQISLLRIFSYSDRIRYYWNDPKVAEAIDRLINNLAEVDLPNTVISQAFMQHELDQQKLNTPELIQNHILTSVNRYFAACGFIQ